ncbi:MAG: hypothetical protein IJW22_03130 [Clostridia bacterium]|nr:hypothetical protein [Clostridia bacterium]
MKAPLEVAIDNLSLWREAAAENRELRLLQAEQMGKAAAKDQLWDSTALRALWSFPEGKPPRDALPLHEMTTEEQVAFCRGYGKRIASPYAEEEPLPPAPPAARVAFFDSFFAREALRRFESVLPLPRPVTVPSFAAVCEELANGRADFALLPVCDSREGKFRRLYEEIDRFELRITHVCDVPYPDEGRTVSMALLTRLYQSPLTKGRCQQLLSCALFEEDEHSLPDVLHAALLSGLSLKSIDTLTAPYGEDGVFYHPEFYAGDESAIQVFEAYLALFAPRARITERYVHLG